MFFEELYSKHGDDLINDIEKSNNTYVNLEGDPKNPPKEIAQKDNAWRSFRKKQIQKPDFMKVMESSKCHKIIMDFMRSKKKVSEIMVLDNMGANVCAFPQTSDYDQGDEGKWFKPFLEGVNPFYGDAEKDESTNKLQIQSSFLIKKKKEVIGVVVIGSSVSLK